MAWRITRDMEHETDKREGREPLIESRKGTVSRDFPAEGFESFRTFSLYDDDGNCYYIGEIDESGYNAAEDIPGSLYGALSWGEWDSGAVALFIPSENDWPFGKPSVSVR